MTNLCRFVLLRAPKFRNAIEKEESKSTLKGSARTLFLAASDACRSRRCLERRALLVRRDDELSTVDTR